MHNANALFDKSAKTEAFGPLCGRDGLHRSRRFPAECKWLILSANDRVKSVLKYGDVWLALEDVITRIVRVVSKQVI